MAYITEEKLHKVFSWWDNLTEEEREQFKSTMDDKYDDVDNVILLYNKHVDDKDI